MIPSYILQALKIIEENNEEAYIVGGAVRNYLLERPINDYDITTSARPEKIKEIFKDYTTVDIGSKYGTIIVIIDKNRIEITTYRTEGDYDGRRPNIVEFSDSLQDDLKRRDFTINAMCYNPKTGVLDYFEGKRDLENKIIRSIGRPVDRLREDYLRILRAVRFACQLNFTIDEDLSSAIKEEKEGLRLISSERIRDEFNKILLSQKPSVGIALLAEHGLLEIISKDLQKMIGFNQYSSFHDLDLYEHTMKTLDGSKPILELRLAALFHDAGKPESFFIDENGEGRFYGHQFISGRLVREFMQEYNYSKNQTERVVRLVERHMDNVNPYTPKSVRKLVRRMDNDIDLLFELQEADVRATNAEVNLDNVVLGRKLAREVSEKNLPTSKKDLVINGGDLIKIGFAPGKELGDFLDYLVDRVIDDNSLNNKKTLLNIAKKHIGG